MSNKHCSPSNNVNIITAKRSRPPSHFLFKVESYSGLLDAGIERIESSIFEGGGHKWKLVLYPSGKGYGKTHLSLYLSIAEVEGLPLGWEVHVAFKLYVHDQIRDKYLTSFDAEEEVKCFHALKTEWGFEQYLAIETLKEPSNGYLVDDSVVLGAEILKVHFPVMSDCFSTIRFSAMKPDDVDDYIEL